MSKLTNNCHYVVIRRQDAIGEIYGEIGFSTMNLGINYYLFILISISDFYKLVGKYKLEEM